MPSPTRADLEDAAVDFFGALAADLDQPRGFDPDRIDDEVAVNVDASAARIRELDGQLVSNEFDKSVNHRAAELIRQSGGDFEKVPDGLKLLAAQLVARRNGNN